MSKALILASLLALGGCAAWPQAQAPHEPHPCDAGEATYACQVQRYHDVAI